MPELPEVETMVRGLRPALEGRTLQSLELVDSFLLHETSVEQLDARSRNQRIRSVNRRGKWVVLNLRPMNSVIVIQPRMTGGFFLEAPDTPRHIRLIFHLAGRRSPQSVWFCDMRRLGKIAAYDNPEFAEVAFSRSQGPEALEIRLDDLASRLARTHRGIKPTLMDQKVLSGIGNIYADEILFRSRLHPETPSSSLSPEQVARIHAAISDVLQRAIAAEGSSFDAGYRTVLGLEGGFLAQNDVHRRAGQPCPACARPILKTNIAGLIGRPTYYCPTCQPEPRAPSRP